jgi:hypothetical protein
MLGEYNILRQFNAKTIHKKSSYEFAIPTAEK